jgi:hypothetical protein
VLAAKVLLGKERGRRLSASITRPVQLGRGRVRLMSGMGFGVIATTS